MKRTHFGLSWPRPPGPDPIACEFCDALQEAPRLREGEAALCGCCGELLFQNRPRSLARATAWSAAGLILMVLVHTFPFLSMSSVGMKTTLTLAGAASALTRDGDPLMALALIFFTMIAPLALIGGLLYVAAPLRHGIAAPGAIPITRWISRLAPWSMLEVFMLGIIVSLLKLGHIAKVEFNVGVWALVGLVICISSAIAGIDRRELWDRLEVALGPKPTDTPEPDPAAP